MKNRILEINPKAEVITHQTFFNSSNSDELINVDYDYIVDAIDTISSKIELIVKAKEKNIQIISSMGAGNKLDPTKFEITDISKTSMCPMARVMRKELKKININSLKTVYSKEEPITPINECDASCKDNCICPEDILTNLTFKRQTPGSISFVPSVVGLIIASEVVKDLIK